MTHSDSKLPHMQQILLFAAKETNPALRTTTDALIDDQLRVEILTDWNLSSEAQTLCDIYYLLHWSNTAFNSRFKPHYTHFLRDGIDFKIQWNCSQGTKKLIFQAERIGLSFRRRRGSEIGIVIPKIMHGMQAP